MKFFPTKGTPKTAVGSVLEYGNRMAARAAYLTVLPYAEAYMQLMGMSPEAKEALRQTPTYELILSGLKTGVEAFIFLDIEAIYALDSKSNSSAGKEGFTRRWTEGTLAADLRLVDVPGFIRSPLQALNDFSPKTPAESMKKCGMALAACVLLTLAAAALPEVAMALNMFCFAGELALIATTLFIPLIAGGAALIDSACEVAAEKNGSEVSLGMM